MFDATDRTTHKKILFPLFLSLAGSMLMYTIVNNVGKWSSIINLMIAIGPFMYVLWNIWQMVAGKFRTKVYRSISIFALFFHGTTITINFYFQGIIATIYGFTLIVLFWNWLTADSQDNVMNELK